MTVPVTHSGKAGKGAIGAGTPVPITLTRWSVREKLDELDGTTAEDDGFEVTDGGVQGARITVDGYILIGATKIAPLAMARGTALSLWRYKIASDVGPLWIFPNFVVLEYEETSEVRGKITFRATLASRGPYTRPADPA